MKARRPLLFMESPVMSFTKKDHIKYIKMRNALRKMEEKAILRAKKEDNQ
jgi:hypothetical protein